MRTIFDQAGYLPQEVRPAELLAEYQQLVARDLKALSSREPLTEQAKCPGCGSSQSRPAFSRFGCDYVECTSCATLWVRKRPSASVVREFYKNSEAERFWQERLAPATVSARASRIVAPRIDWMTDSIQEYHPRARVIADVSTQLAIFADRFAGMKGFDRRIVIEPLASISVPGLEVVDRPIEELDHANTLDIVSLFDVADRSSDVEAVIGAVHRALGSGGLVFLTGILSTGFDIQTLWDRAATIFPPDRLNVFSVAGLTQLLERRGFEILEFSTPGAFDVKSVERACKNDPDIVLPRFVETLLRRGEDDHLRFQNFLQAALLSSFGRVVARKRPTSQ